MVDLLQTREEFIKHLQTERNKIRYEVVPKWSDPLYICPKCGGNVRKNLWLSPNSTTNTRTYASAYTCDSCGFTEYMVD